MGADGGGGRCGGDGGGFDGLEGAVNGIGWGFFGGRRDWKAASICYVVLVARE